MNLDYSKVNILTTEARPTRKQNEIYEIVLDGKKYWCERPKYLWNRFDQDILLPIALKEGKILFSREVPIFFDQHGRQWFAEELTSKFLLNYYIKNPLKFVQIMSRRVTQVKKILKILEEINKNIGAEDISTLKQNYQEVLSCFDLFYDTGCSVFMLYDEFVYCFRQVLLQILDKREANTYFSEFLQAEMTKEALRLGHIQEFDAESRATTYGKTKPILFYKEPKFFYESSMDIQIVEKIMKADVSTELKEEFFALRLITPIAIQINEEAQYVESRMITAHFAYIIDTIAKIFIKHNLIVKREDIDNMESKEILTLLDKVSNEINQKQSDGDKRTWIPEYIAAVHAALGAMDFGTLQPFSPLEFEPLFAKEWVDRIKLLMHKAKEQRVTAKELAMLWPTTSGARCQLYFLLEQLKCATTPKEDRVAIAEFFFEMIKERAVADVHGRISNICRTKEQLDILLNTLKFSQGTSAIAQTLGKIYNAAYNLGCGLYLDFYLDYCVENEGPYDVSEIYGPGHILVIKKVVGMQTPLWPELQVPCNDLYIYSVYKNVKFTCDLISAHSVYEGDVINNLVAYAVIVDNKNLITEGVLLSKVVDQLSNLSVLQWKKLKSLDQEEQKQRGLLVKCYGMKKIFERVGMSWQPDEGMKEAVKAPLKDNTYWKIPEDNKEEYWNNLDNPEIDFYPGEPLK